jgi:tripartite-type tricarboxylate transporter receptor subunit TctC
LGAVVSEAVGGTSEDFKKYLSEERTRWGALIKDLGLKA